MHAVKGKQVPREKGPGFHCSEMKEFDLSLVPPFGIAKAPNDVGVVFWGEVEKLTPFLKYVVNEGSEEPGAWALCVAL